MTAITVKDVPDPIADGLKLKAAKAGKSLQAFLIDVFTREATTPSLAEAVERMEAIAGADLTGIDIAALTQEGRERR